MKKGAVSYLFDNHHMKLHEGTTQCSFFSEKLFFTFMDTLTIFIWFREIPLSAPPENFLPKNFPPENSTPRKIPALGKFPPGNFSS